MNCIFFLHFHKAGGTSINALFNNYNKWKPNRNGNPWIDNKIITFWNYNKEEFNNLKNELFKSGNEFVAFEWNYFKFFKEIDYNNIELITCIRDPYERFISNMLVDNYIDSNNFNKKNIKWTRSNCSQEFFVNYNKYNYYTKMLNGFGDKPDIEINNNHLEIAKKNLSNFSTILILEDKETFRLLKKYNKIYKNKIYKNKNENKNTNIIVINIEEFKKVNKYDYKLYEYAKELSHIQLKKSGF